MLIDEKDEVLSLNRGSLPVVEHTGQPHISHLGYRAVPRQDDIGALQVEVHNVCDRQHGS